MYDVIIIGSGVAGMAAAVYTLRNNKSTLLLESSGVGGQIAYSAKVENMPSYRTVSGAELSQKVFEQVLDLGVRFEMEEVLDVEKKGETFTVTTDYGVHEGKTVIIATGVKQKHIGIANEEKLLGKGVYYCAICDGAFYKDKEVAVIGDGNTALQSVALLAAICKKVYVLTWFDKFFGDEGNIDAVKRLKNVEVLPNTSVVDFKGENSLEALVVENRLDKTRFELAVPAVFVAIGQIPDNKRFEKIATLDKDGYIVGNDLMETGVEGAFVAGDCRKKTYRQLLTAMNDGAIAAMGAVNYVNKKK